jgi:tetratricopeptide (TPR) repeat protein
MGGREKLLALQHLGRTAGGWDKTWRAVMRDADQNYLELAATSIRAGLPVEADAVLDDVATRRGEGRLDPMVHYLRGSVRTALGDTTGAAEQFVRAGRGSLAGVNPHRVEEKVALEDALRVNPKDAHAHHLLGNVLYGLGRREDGLAHWREAIRLDERQALSWRNIGYAEQQLNGDDRAAREAYLKAFALDPADARVLLELDQVAERLGLPASERRSRLEASRATVDKRDDLVMRWIDLRLATGSRADLEEGHQVLRSRRFHTWEGLYDIHYLWIDLNHRLGDLALEARDLEAALSYYRRAFEYPKNLETAPRTPDFQAHLNWKMAHAYLTLGRPEEARSYLERILAEHHPRPGVGAYYQALAEKARGDETTARSLLGSLEEAARESLRDPTGRRARQDAIGYYLLSLALAGRGDAAGAAAAREKAESLDPHPARAALRQAQIQYAGGHQ